MPAEWVTAVAGLVGALAGSAVTLAVGYMQRGDAKSARLAQAADRRHAVTGSYLAAADAFLGLSRELTEAIDALPSRTAPSDLEESDPRLADLHRRYVDAWNQLEVSLGQVQITLTDDEVVAAAHFVDMAGDWSDIIDWRWRARQWRPGQEPAREAAYMARRHFIAKTSNSSGTRSAPTAP